MALIRFADCTLLDATQPQPREGCDVVVENGRIVEVADRPCPSPGADVVNVGGRTLMPGLIDAHVHAIAVDANLGRLKEMPASLMAHKAGQALSEMLQRGFTSVRDAGGADAGLAEAVEAGLIPGPRLFPAGKALSQTGGHGDLRPRTAPVEACACAQSGTDLTRIADGVSEVRRAARDELRKGATQIKIMASGGVASPHDPLWANQYSEEEMRAIVEEARAWRTYVMAHAYTAQSIRRAIDFGVRSIEHANLIDRETAAHAAKAGAFVVPTLVTYDSVNRHAREFGLPESSIAKLAEVRVAGIESLAILHQAGVKIGFGTDLLGFMQVDQSLEFTIRAEVLSPFEVICQATANNAELLNRADDLGVIKVGAIADLLVVDGNPLDNLGLLQNQGAHLSVIMKDGRFFKRLLQ